MRRRLLLQRMAAVSVAVHLRAVIPAQAQGVSVLGPGVSLAGLRFFPPDSPWNQDVSASPVDPNSAALIASIGLDRGLHPDFGTTRMVRISS